MPEYYSQKSAPCCGGIRALNKYNDDLAPTSLHTKQHFEQFSHFCRAQAPDQHTQHLTPDRPCYACNKRPSPTSCTAIIYFASAAVAVDSSHMTASSSTSWSRFSPPSNFVNGHVSTMWFKVCRWPQSQKGDWARPHLCTIPRHGPSSVWKWFIRDHV